MVSACIDWFIINDELIQQLGGGTNNGITYAKLSEL